MEIYKVLFSEVKLNVHILARAKLRKGDLDDNKLRLLSFFGDNEKATLFSCHQVLDEATEFLARSTILKIEYSPNREDPTALLPTWFIQRVPQLEVQLPAFVHINRKRMEALKHINLIQTAEGVDDSSSGYHILRCEYCGGENAQNFIETVMEGVRSWDWMRKQIVYLSTEEGWKVSLSTRLGYTMDEDNNYLVSRVPSARTGLTDIVGSSS